MRPIDVVATRRRTGAAAFVLICAPCFVGFLVLILPLLGGALLGSLLVPSVVGALGGLAAAVALLVWRRLRRVEALAACDTPAAPPAAVPPQT